MAFNPNPDRDATVAHFQRTALRFGEIAVEIEALGSVLDDSAKTCDGCGSTHYNNWPQRQLRARVMGAAERMRELADVFRRRANDDTFLNGEDAAGDAS